MTEVNITKKILKNYIDAVRDLYSQEESTELSFYPLLSSFLQEILGKEFNIIVNPKKPWGLPDLVINSHTHKSFLRNFPPDNTDL
jgi:hypothetical protein